jgi:VWFA-related protein
MRSTGAKALLVAAALCAVVQAQSPKPQAPPQFRAGANFVHVDMHATRDGVPVEDLRVTELELLEDGVPQSIQSFEHIVLTPDALSAPRSDPNSVEASRQLAALGRNRIVILFLDAPHVTAGASVLIAEPLIRMLDRILGADDLIAVMTPEMRVSDLALARKTDVLQQLLRGPQGWGRRFERTRFDAQEQLYDACYPRQPKEAERGKWISALAQALIERRRERMSLDALHALVDYLGELRDERKAILTITEGWRLERSDDALLGVQGNDESRNRRGAGRQAPRVDSEGRLTLDPTDGNVSKQDCEADRMRLANMDNRRYFEELIDEANRASASFYTIDPRGLAVFDLAVQADAPPEVIDPFLWDQHMLKERQNTLRVLADNTDGMAMVGIGDVDRGLARIAADFTSYYLLGYASSNTKLDGSFRRITVRVKRPDVTVRARRGYRAPSEEEVAATRTVATPAIPEAVKPVNAALADLARARSDTPFRINVVPRPGGNGVTTLWVAGEVRGAAASNRTAEGQVDIQVSGGATGSSQISLPPGERAFMTAITLDKPVASGAVDVRVRVNGLGVIPLTDNVRVDAVAPRALVFRRGPATGNRVRPAGDPQFSRTERVRLEVPIAPGVTLGEGRVLDRTGNPLAVPVTIAERTEEGTGQRWLTADLTLAPLTLGDYAIEMGFIGQGGREERVLTGIRVTR